MISIALQMVFGISVLDVRLLLAVTSRGKFLFIRMYIIRNVCSRSSPDHQIHSKTIYQKHLMRPSSMIFGYLFKVVPIWSTEWRVQYGPFALPQSGLTMSVSRIPRGLKTDWILGGCSENSYQEGGGKSMMSSWS